MYTILKHCDVLLEIHTVFAYMKVYVSDGEQTSYTQYWEQMKEL